VSETLYAISVEVNGKPRSAQVPARCRWWTAARRPLPHRHAHRLRARHLRCVLVDAGRRARAFLPHVRRAGEPPPRHTVEGLAKPDGSLSVLQDSFCEAHGLQCGYCTPGMLSPLRLLNSNPNLRAQIATPSAKTCAPARLPADCRAVQLAAGRMAKEAK